MNLAQTNTVQQPTTPATSSEARTAQGNPWPLRAFYAFLAFLVVFVSSFAIFKPITVLPRITLAPGFIFEDTAGETITSEDFRGGLTLYSFTYTACESTGECPQSVADIRQVYDHLNRIAPDDYPVSLVTISLDPERDTTAVWAETEESLGLVEGAPVDWHFLSNDPLRTKSVVGGGFDVFYDKRSETGSDDYFIRFEPQYVLVDGLGIIRAYYDDPVPSLDIITRDLDLVLTEARNSSGVARLGYEAAHLFVCYP